MDKTWKATTAGILNIISGAFSALGAIGFIIALTASGSWMCPAFADPGNMPFVGPLVSTVLIVLLVWSIIGAVFPIMGGVFALQRKQWGWALAGSIIAILSSFGILGILSTIFVSLAKDEFATAEQST